MNKVLITGGNGFLGHHMIDHILSTTNLEVIALNITGNKHRIESLDSFYKEPNRLRFIKHDISTPLDKELLKESVDLILHMGGESHVLPSIQNPLNTVITNAGARYCSPPSKIRVMTWESPTAPPAACPSVRTSTVVMMMLNRATKVAPAAWAKSF